MDDDFRGTGRTDGGQSISDFDAPELSAKELMEHHSGAMATALERTGIIEVVETTVESANSVQFLCRVKTQNIEQLQSLIHSLVWKFNGTEYQEHIGTKYIPKKGPRGEQRTVFGWIFCFMGPEPLQLSRLVCGAVDDLFPREEVLESPLVGPGTPQGGGPGSGKKGASPVRG